jgi:hypothetical protein
MINLTPAFFDRSAPLPPDTSAPDDLAGDRHRRLIGYTGLLLPFFIIALVKKRDGELLWGNLTSISDYYYTGANAAFVGMLVTLALFLFAYRGFGNRQNWADLWVARIAASAALVVAFFPTRVPLGFTALQWWGDWVGVVHYVAAVVLFSMFALFALWLFRKKAEGEKAVSDGKKWRNRVYLGCGILIVISMIWAGWNAFNERPIFWPETWALIFFSTSWLVKGYAHAPIVKRVRSLVPQPSARSV